MRTLIFNIETVGEEWDSLDVITKDVLTGWVDRASISPAERETHITTIQNTLGYSPFTGRIISLGVYDLERAQGAVYYVGVGSESDEEIGPYVFKQRSEVALLREFWDGALEYDTFVTFNGRAFDVPFLLHRSIALGVRPTRELMKYRYLSHQSAPFHIDLQDELTFYGAMRKRPSLHVLCRAYGIQSPKVNDVSGDAVAKNFRDIAHYAAADVVAVTALYKIWLANLAPASFINSVDL